jgi:2-dehydropantoate 2-reductase
MKIAVVGCGALGSFYGAKLCRSGLDVHFLLRSDYEPVRRQGVSIRSPEGDFRVQPNCARNPDEIGRSDLVLIGLKTTANRQFGPLLHPLVGPGTAILTLQNGLGNEEQLATIFPASPILGGLCFVCLNRISPGTIQHIDHGRVVVGEFSGCATSYTHKIADLFRKAGIPCEVTEDLARSHWEKLVWNIPFNGLGVASAAGYEALFETERTGPLVPSHRCRTTDQLLGDPPWQELVRELMTEVIRAANALGLKVSASLGDELIRRTLTMGAYKASTVLDFEQRRPLELEALFLEPLKQAQEAGLSSPRLSALCSVLRRLDNHSEPKA